MAGKDDIRMLSAYVYSKVKDSGVDDEEVGAVGSVVMNRATSLGSLTEAIQSMSPSQDVINIMQGNVSGKEEREYKRVIQLTSKLLRGSMDPTSGAVDILPKRSKVDKSLGLIKSHATKNYNYYRQSGAPISSKSRVPSVQATAI